MVCIPDLIAQDLAQALSQPALIKDIGPRLTCYEAESVAGVLRWIGGESAASQWLREHSASDDDTDDHYLERLYYHA